MLDFQHQETHLNRTNGFDGSRVRMSSTTSSGKLGNHDLGIAIAPLFYFNQIWQRVVLLNIDYKYNPLFG